MTPSDEARLAEPSDAEREAQDRVAMFIDFCALNKFGLDGWPPRTVAELTAHFTLVLNERDEAQRERDERPTLENFQRNIDERNVEIDRLSAQLAEARQTWFDPETEVTWRPATAWAYAAACKALHKHEDEERRLTAQVEEMRAALILAEDLYQRGALFVSAEEWETVHAKRRKALGSTPSPAQNDVSSEGQ